MLQAGHGPRELQRLLLIGCLSVFEINTTVGVEHARPILLMCRNYCRLLEGSSMLDPYNEHHPETGYAPGIKPGMPLDELSMIEVLLSMIEVLGAQAFRPAPRNVGPADPQH